jgi:hypothetical protein
MNTFAIRFAQGDAILRVQELSIMFKMGTANALPFVQGEIEEILL